MFGHQAEMNRINAVGGHRQFHAARSSAAWAQFASGKDHANVDVQAFRTGIESMGPVNRGVKKVTTGGHHGKLRHFD